MDRLVLDGHDVAVIDDLSTGSVENIRHAMKDIAFFRGKVKDIDTSLLRATDVVIHLAAKLGVEAVLNKPTSQFDNVDDVNHILSVAKQTSTKVLFASTSSVYGQQEPPLIETSKLVMSPDVISTYSCAKLMGEYLCNAYAQESGVKTGIVRIFNTCGPRAALDGPYSFVLQRFVNAALKEEDLLVYGDGTQTRSFTYVRDTIKAIVKLLPSVGFGVGPVNIGSTQEISILDLARRVREVTGSLSQIRFLPYKSVHPNMTDYRRRVPNTEKLLSLTGYTPETSIDEIIYKTAQWINR